MIHLRRSLLLVLCTALFIPLMALPAHASGGSPLVIKVDAYDPANQQFLPPFNRSFEYSDFFPRLAIVQQGRTIDFQTQQAALHEVVLSRYESTARAAYPLMSTDTDANEVPAPGTGLPKIKIDAGAGPITGGSTSGGGKLGGYFGTTPCGLVQSGQSPCTFTGGQDVEGEGQVRGTLSSGALGAVDWDITVNAPPGLYTYFCMLHPGMRGALYVVSPGLYTTSQADLDSAASLQFTYDQQAALAAEKAANVITYTGGDPGTRTYDVQVGISAASDHVAINEMLPNLPLNLVKGDKVSYHWSDDHNFHTVGFPGTGDARIEPELGEPLDWDCGQTWVSVAAGFCTEPGDTGPELILDPGNAPPGTALTNPTTLTSSGTLVGTAFGVSPSSQLWAVTTDQSSAAGVYLFQCTVHDWMQGRINLS